VTDVRRLLRRAEAIARQRRRRAGLTPSCVTCPVFEDDNAVEVERYGEEVKARFADEAPDLIVVVVRLEARRPKSLRAPWHRPRWWLDYVPSPAELCDLRLGLRGNKAASDGEQ